MRLSDIEVGTDYAVKIPHMVYGRRDGSKVVRAAVQFKQPPHLVTVKADDDTLDLRPAAVIASWADYALERDHAEAIYLDRQFDWDRQRKREQAERAARIERFLPAFADLPIPAEGTSTANVPRPDVDLAEELRRIFITGGASGSMFEWEVFEAIAQRVLALTEIASQSALTSADAAHVGWAPSPAANAAVQAANAPKEPASEVRQIIEVKIEDGESIDQALARAGVTLPAPPESKPQRDRPSPL